MNRDKKDIILNEIEHWRDSRLLPEQYCDFLSNLYYEPKSVRSKPFSLSSLKYGNSKALFLTFGIISLICFIGFYFSSFSWALQILTTAFAVGICYGYAGVYKRSLPLISLMLAGTASLVMLLFGVWIIKIHVPTEELWIPVLIAGCGMIWFLLGYVLKIGLLHYCGLGGWLLLYERFCAEYKPDFSWIQLQLVWIPFAILFICLCWLLHRRNKMLSQVYFSIGLTIWFVPELDSILLRHQSPEDIVFLCLFKVAVALAMLFFLRKKWIVWVAS